MKQSINYQKLTIWLIVVAVFVRFIIAFFYSVSGDACWHLSAARFISEEGKIPLFEPIGRDEPFWAPPLFHIIAALSYSIFGNVGLKLISPLFGSLCLIVGYGILKKYLNERAAFYGMLFFSFIPIMIDYSILGYGESVLMFFILLSLYFGLEGKFAFAGLVAGLAILSKYNGAFVVPVLMWLAWNNKERWRNMALVCFLPILISLPWFIRNFMVLGNPIWPFLNFLFPQAFQNAFSTLNLSALWSLQTWQALYLGFFGVPDGNYASLSLIPLPFFNAAFFLFLMGTVLFISPLFFGWNSKRENIWSFVLLGSFFSLFLVYVVNVGPFVSRILLPSVIVLALVYGKGMEAIIKLTKKEQWALWISVLFALGFGVLVFGKFTVAHNAWSFYQEDFDWVKENTPKNAVFLAGGQCVQFHIERQSLFSSKQEGYQYVWINEGFSLDKRSILDKARVREETAKSELVYENKNTKTRILKRTS